MKNIFLFCFALFVVFGLVIRYAVLQTPKHMQSKIVENKNKTITEIYSTDQAPSKTMRANIASMSGQVQWQSRTATQPAALALVSPIQFQQGETIITPKKSSITLKFPNDSTAVLFPETHLYLFQTLPDNLVFNQSAGTVEYTNITSTALAVRSLSLLVQLNAATATISIEKNSPFITVHVKNGAVKAAFNDADQVSMVFDIPPGKTVEFNNDEKKAELQ